jgi:hypothetical protein
MSVLVVRPPLDSKTQLIRASCLSSSFLSQKPALQNGHVLSLFSKITRTMYQNVRTIGIMCVGLLDSIFENLKHSRDM